MFEAELDDSGNQRFKTVEDLIEKVKKRYLETSFKPTIKRITTGGVLYPEEERLRANGFNTKASRIALKRRIKRDKKSNKKSK